MKINAVNVDLEAFGAWFANQDSRDQALFFKGLVMELKNWDTRHLASMQFSYVGSELLPEHREFLENVVFCMIAGEFSET